MENGSKVKSKRIVKEEICHKPFINKSIVSNGKVYLIHLDGKTTISKLMQNKDTVVLPYNRMKMKYNVDPAWLSDIQTKIRENLEHVPLIYSNKYKLI